MVCISVLIAFLFRPGYFPNILMNDVRMIGVAITNILTQTYRSYCDSLPPGEEKFHGIVDMKGAGLSNFDATGMIAAFSLLQVSLSLKHSLPFYCLLMAILCRITIPNDWGKY